MNIKEFSIYHLQADICKIFTNPIRLMIIEQLGGGGKSVSEIEKNTGVRQATLSQHLAVLRSKDIVVVERRGRQARYRLSDMKILQACRLMREVMLSQLKRKSKLLWEMNKMKGAKNDAE